MLDARRRNKFQKILAISRCGEFIGNRAANANHFLTIYFPILLIKFQPAQTDTVDFKCSARF